LTTTPVPGPSSPRFPFSLIPARGITLLAGLMILAFCLSANAFSFNQAKLTVPPVIRSDKAGAASR
jgi:hypothetical protein